MGKCQFCQDREDRVGRRQISDHSHLIAGAQEIHLSKFNDSDKSNIPLVYPAAILNCSSTKRAIPDEENL